MEELEKELRQLRRRVELLEYRMTDVEDAIWEEEGTEDGEEE